MFYMSQNERQGFHLSASMVCCCGLWAVGGAVLYTNNFSAVKLLKDYDKLPSSALRILSACSSLLSSRETTVYSANPSAGSPLVPLVNSIG